MKTTTKTETLDTTLDMHTPVGSTFPTAVNTFFTSETFFLIWKGFVEAGEDAGWSPELALIDATGEAFLIAALTGDSSKDIPALCNFLRSTPRLAAHLSKAAFAVIVSEGWVSANPSVRPSVAADRKSVLAVATYRVVDGDLVLISPREVFTFAEAQIIVKAMAAKVGKSL